MNFAELGNSSWMIPQGWSVRPWLQILIFSVLCVFAHAQQGATGN